MGYVRIQDTIGDHPKFLEVGLSAIGLWTLGMVYANKHLTDGHLPGQVVRQLWPEPNSRRAAIKRLVGASLWVPSGDGYTIANYLTFNDSRSKVLLNKAKAAERQRRHREKSRRDQRDPPHVRGVTSDFRHIGSMDSANALSLESPPDDGPPTNDPGPPTFGYLHRFKKPPKPQPAEVPRGVLAVWEHYTKCHAEHVKHGPKPKLTQRRKANIKARLRDFTVAQLKQAIDALWSSEFHLREGFTAPEQVFRSTEQTEKHLNAKRAPKAATVQTDTQSGDMGWSGAYGTTPDDECQTESEPKAD